MKYIQSLKFGLTKIIYFYNANANAHQPSLRTLFLAMALNSSAEITASTTLLLTFDVADKLATAVL